MSSEKTLGISGIAIKPERLRSLQPERVAELAGSMAKLGQLQPIIVRPVGKTGSGNGYWLIAGRHRLEAAKQLKWPAIRAVVLENVKADMAELIEIDENLIRAELSAAERAIHVGRRKEIYERQHPQTKHGAAPGRAGGGKAKGTNLDSFAKATAKVTGQSETKVKRDATRAKALDKLLNRINGTSLDKGAEMDALRRLPEDEQEALVARAAAGEQVSAKEALAAKKSRAKSEPAAPFNAGSIERPIEQVKAEGAAAVESMIPETPTSRPDHDAVQAPPPVEPPSTNDTDGDEAFHVRLKKSLDAAIALCGVAQSWPELSEHARKRRDQLVRELHGLGFALVKLATPINKKLH